MSEKEEPNNEDKIAPWVYIVVGLVSVGMVILGHTVEAGQNELTKFLSSWSIHVFMKELGFAGVIALILIGTIERFTRKRHERAADDLVKRINNDLFHAIYERYIPHSVFNEVEKGLMKSNVYRKNLEVYYTLESFPDDEKIDGLPCDRHLKCSMLNKYDLKNITDKPIEHDVILNLELPIDPGWERYCKITEIEIDGERLPPAAIKEKTETTSIQICFCHTITIKPGDVVSVMTKAELIKRKLDQELWTSRLPSDGIKLTVTVPMKDLEVDAHALHLEEVKPILDTEVTKSWELRHGIFPFQSVVFWWHPKQTLTCPIAQ